MSELRDDIAHMILPFIDDMTYAHARILADQIIRVVRDSDRLPQGEDAKRLSAEQARTVPEGQSPTLPLNPGDHNV